MCEPSTSGTEGGRRGGQKLPVPLEGKEERERQAGGGKVEGEVEGGEVRMGIPPASPEVVCERESSGAERDEVEREEEEEEHREGVSEAPPSAAEPVSPGQRLYGALYGTVFC